MLGVEVGGLVAGLPFISNFVILIMLYFTCWIQEFVLSMDFVVFHNWVASAALEIIALDGGFFFALDY